MLPLTVTSTRTLGRDSISYEAARFTARRTGKFGTGIVCYYVEISCPPREYPYPSLYTPEVDLQGKFPSQLQCTSSN